MYGDQAVILFRPPHPNPFMPCVWVLPVGEGIGGTAVISYIINKMMPGINLTSAGLTELPKSACQRCHIRDDIVSFPVFGCGIPDLPVPCIVGHRRAFDRQVDRIHEFKKRSETIHTVLAQQITMCGFPG